jgi:hypothetical protein
VLQPPSSYVSSRSRINRYSRDIGIKKKQEANGTKRNKVITVIVRQGRHVRLGWVAFSAGGCKQQSEPLKSRPPLSTPRGPPEEPPQSSSHLPPPSSSSSASSSSPLVSRQFGPHHSHGQESSCRSLVTGAVLIRKPMAAKSFDYLAKHPLHWPPCPALLQAHARQHRKSILSSPFPLNEGASRCL